MKRLLTIFCTLCLLLTMASPVLAEEIHQTESFRIPDGSSLSGQFDDNISKNIELGCAVLSHNIILHIVLGAGDPENAALGKPPEVFEVDIRLVKDDNFTFTDSLAKCRRFRRIVRVYSTFQIHFYLFFV